MAYDHSDRIGNQGDLVKHLALLVAIDGELNSGKLHERFVYKETHAGRAVYTLPANGAWRDGIGEFSANRRVVAVRKKGNDSHIAKFDRLAIGRRLTTGMKYLGSSGLVFKRMRQQRNVDFKMVLYDEDQAVVDDLQRYFEPFHFVTVQRGNGLGPPVNDADFVFVDPISVSDEADHPVATYVRRLEEHGVPFLLWAPRTGNARREEAATSRGFRERLESAAPVHFVKLRWRKTWFGGTCGCQLACHRGHLFGSIETAVVRLAQIMKWYVD